MEHSDLAVQINANGGHRGVSAIVLNWNELHVVKGTIEFLNQETLIDEIILVDNGSRDGSPEYFTHLSKRREYVERVRTVLLNKNYGSSIGRNVGLGLASRESIFLIDGDILYVPGTIPFYQKILDSYPECGCVGYNDYERVQATGMNGTANYKEAQTVMQSTVQLSKWFPMAWTQYGLFRGDLLRKLQFVTEGCFGECGHGYEDDWLYHAMEQEGYYSIAVNAPLYYHDGHYSLRLMQEMNLSDRGEERAKLFYAKWGEGNGWRERMGTIPYQEKRPFRVYPS
jgi:glycosyltransferase involved in cell wall biosynthesis